MVSSAGDAPEEDVLRAIAYFPGMFAGSRQIFGIKGKFVASYD
jgi:hypothetical protein